MTTTIELYTRRVAGIRRPPVVGGFWMQEDSRPCMHRLNGYVEDLNKDIERTVVPSDIDPDALEKDVDTAVAGGASGWVVDASREQIAALRKVRKGKDAAQIAREIAFYKAWQKWRKSDWVLFYSKVDTAADGEGPVSDVRYARCLDFERAFSGANGWRDRYKAIGPYVPTTEAPTVADIKAAEPKEPGSTDPLGSIAGAIGSVAAAVPWVVGGGILFLTLQTWRAR